LAVPCRTPYARARTLCRVLTLGNHSSGSPAADTRPRGPAHRLRAGRAESCARSQDRPYDPVTAVAGSATVTATTTS
jgi:hypothetical protein